MQRYFKTIEKSSVEVEVESQNCSNMDSNCKQLSPKKKKFKISSAWKHFKASSDKRIAKCLICKKEYKTSGNTSNLRDHLKRVHPEIENESENEEENFNLEFPQASTSTSNISSDNNKTNMKSVTSYFKRCSEYETSSMRKKQIDQALALMIALDYQPYNIVENDGFKYFTKILDPRYTLPSKHSLKNNYIKTLFSSAKVELERCLSQIQYIGITCDLWTSCVNESYLTVSCHFINLDFELKSAVLSTKKLLDFTNHKAENIATSVEEVLTEWKINEKVTCIVTDNAASMIKACEILKLKHLPCFAHSLNLVVQDGLNVESIKPVLTRCKEIVKYFKKSSIATEKFKLAQETDKPYSLIQDVSTRWNSTYYMIKRILKTNEAISKTLLSSRKAPPPLTIEEILILTDIEKLLDFLKKPQKRFLEITITSRLQNEIFTEEAKAANEVLLNSIRQRLFLYEKRSIPRIATIIDPRFKKEGFLAGLNAEQASILLENEMVTLLRNNDIENCHGENNFEGQQKEHSKEVNSIFGFLENRVKQKTKSVKADAIVTKRQFLEKINSSQSTDPLLFWKVAGAGMHPLPECALKFLCIPGSSVESERIFSTTGLIITDRRNRLKDKHVNILVFLNKNKWLIKLN